MWLTDGQIVVLYRDAADRAEQINILIELNACRREDIENILTANGYKISKPHHKGCWAQEKEERYKELLPKGVSIANIARQMGISYYSASQKKRQLEGKYKKPPKVLGHQ